jgi:hypothetical protein
MSHDHATSAESRAAGPRPVRALLLFSLLLLVLLAAVLAGMKLTGGGTPTEAEDAARAETRLKNLSDLRAADSNQLSTYGWNDRSKGIVHIPVAKAMELILPELGKATPSAVSAPAGGQNQVSSQPLTQSPAAVPATSPSSTPSMPKP